MDQAALSPAHRCLFILSGHRHSLLWGSRPAQSNCWQLLTPSHCRWSAQLAVQCNFWPRHQLCAGALALIAGLQACWLISSPMLLDMQPPLAFSIYFR